MSTLLSIGEVSRITGLTLKALRLYHEKGLLRPSRIDEESGYRYYTPSDVNRAMAIRALRDLKLSMDEIRDVLGAVDDGRLLREALSEMRARLAEEVASSQRALLAVDALARHEEQAQAYLRSPPPIAVTDVPARRVASVRARGRYSDASVHFPRLFAAVGPSAAGLPFCLFHEPEYREDDADISFCVPVRDALDGADGVSVETAPAHACAVVVHTGPYDSVGPSWARLFAHVRALGKEVRPPLRETYLRHGDDPAACVTELAVLMSISRAKPKGA